MKALERIKNQCGFTLTEVLIASVLLVITIAPVLMSLITGRTTLEIARHQGQAMQVARSHMDFLISKGYDFVNSLPSEYAGGSGLPLDTKGDEGGITYAYKTLVTDVDADGLLEVTIEVGWTERGRGSLYGRWVYEQLYFIYPPGEPT